VQQRLRRIDAAAGCLEQLAADCAVFVVDDRGRIDDWRPGAARLFGWSADDIRGRSAEHVFAATGDIGVEQLLSATPAGDASRLVRTCCRADGTSFDADLEIHRLDDEGPRAFIVVVHDRTREQEWRAFADASADLQTTLREEADVAQRQLATLQHVTDPMLNQLSNAQAITALLDRLRAAIEADGVAVVRSARPRRRIVSATDGLAADSTAERRPGEGWTPQPGRILIVHNDPARVEAASIAGWRDEPVSLIAVPVVAGSHVEATIEAVRLKARRSTEWEIALVQVVAAQIAGRLQSESMFGADAVA
jgi:PAS domain S-box-containing protein